MQIDSTTQTMPLSLYLGYFKIDFYPNAKSYDINTFIPSEDSTSIKFVSNTYLRNIHIVTGVNKNSSETNIRIISAGNKLFIGYYCVNKKMMICRHISVTGQFT